MKPVSRRRFLSTSVIVGSSLLSPTLLAQEPRGNTTEPVLHVANLKNTKLVNAPTPHPLDPALQMAQSSLRSIRSSIRDYTAILVKREQINGDLGDYEYIGTKIRNRQVENGQIKVPFSVYMTFLKPASIKGREVIYVENKNNGNLVAHEGGMKGRFLPTVNLDPTGMMAMRNQRYPITDLGVENLVIKLIEKGERDKKQGVCAVDFHRGAKVGGRPCTVVSVRHDEKKPCFDFHIAQIFIDDELNIPIRYCAYEWPKQPGGDPVLLEEYTYQKLRLNVGLTDKDFDRDNPKYNF